MIHEGIGGGARRLDVRLVPRAGGLRGLDGSAPRSTEPAAARTPLPAPDVALTSDEKQVWAKLPPDRSAIPVLLYHGIGPESDFSNAADASYGVGTEDFAKQMTMIQHAGYQTIDLQTFIDFVQNKPVELPPRPLLLTFDDARADSWTGADGILRKLHFNAVMFVDVGRVDGGDPEYLTWQELATVQDSGRWQLQLHSGKGHTQIHYGPGPDDYGPFYAYEAAGRGLRRLARPGPLRHRLGPDDARRSHLRPTSRSPSLPRTAATARTAPTTRGSPTTSSAGSRTATTPSSPRTSTHERKPGADSRSAGSRSPAPPPEASLHEHAALRRDLTARPAEPARTPGLVCDHTQAHADRRRDGQTGGPC